jgi:alkyl sulfatase BDS1-like metallo-beta-lactamase superfamily hydrolase
MSPPEHDPLHQLRSLSGRLLADATQLPERLSQIVQSSTSRGLEELLQTPARRLVLEVLFWELGRRLGRRAPARQFSVRCTVTAEPNHSPEVFELIFGDGQANVTRGRSTRRPELTVSLDERELVRLATGHSSPLQAVFTGRVKIGGDVGALAALLLTVPD